MNLKELDSFKISDAVTFHDKLNPALWAGTKLRPEVKNQLEEIAKDFLEEMGIHDLDVRDITISGSNAAFSYTPNSDLDLHILVNIADLPNNDIYKELFHAKKSLYNDNHDITIHGVPVELYVQDAAQPSVSLGEYSLQDDKWLRIPTKRRANLDQSATKAKYEKLVNIIELALQSKDVHKVDKVLKKLKQYRQAGLDNGGEFGPENLSFKAVRSQGLITQLYALRDKLHSQRLSIEGMYSIDEEKDKLHKHTPTIEQLLIKYKVPKRDILIQLDKGIKVELEHTGDRKVAREIALDHLGEDPHYYNKLAKAELEEARTNPDQNPKPESGMKELASIAKTISDPENWAISMTSEPKLGINPQVGVSEDTPKGIYFYPLNYAVDKTRYGKLPWGNDYPYIQLFQYDRSREMTKKTKVDPANLKQALLQYCPEEVIQSAIDEPEYDGTPYWFIYDCLSRLGNSDETNIVRWNKVLRDLGFTSVFDDGAGWIAYNEPTQGVVLDPRIIKQHKTIDNKQKSKLITPAVIEQAIFETMDMELASNRAWQKYDPDGSKLRQAAKEYAKKPEFKQWFGKSGSEEIFDKAASWGRYGARQLSQEAYEWFKEQQAQQPVTEAFDQPYKILRWEKGNHGDVDAIARLDDNTFLSIMFNKGFSQETKEEAWSVEFFRNNSQDVTGEGDAQRVFATVLSSIQTFIKKYKPNKVFFAANKVDDTGHDSPSRARLYDSLVQRYARAWGFKSFRADNGNKVIYELSRINKVEEASGYIPSNAQKNDPRFSTALTVDVKPDSIKKNAKAFSWLTTRAGIPPTAKPSGKI